MVQKGRSVHVSGVNCVANKKNGVEVSQRKRSEADKYWGFLDEIEAPMWLDLTLEFQSTYHDKDAEWFDISHQFHQCSSRQLISAKDCTDFNLEVRDQSSPKLPPSVSRSRGKEHRSRALEEGNQKVIFNQQRPVKNISTQSSNLNLEPKKMARNKRSSGMPIELPGSKSDSTCESHLTDNAGQHDLNLVPPSRYEIFCLDSNFSKEGDSNSKSSITFEGTEQQQQKSFDVSSQVFSQTTGFLSALKISLRKSCVTRQASRVELGNRRQSEGQKSSSSKSSVGSSSNLCFHGKYLKARENKDMTPDSRSIMRLSKAPNASVNKENLSMVPAVGCRDITSNPKSRSRNSTLQSIYDAKLKAKVLAPKGVEKHCALAVSEKAKEKAAASGCGRFPAGGKENTGAKLSANQKSSTGDAVQVQKVVRRREPEKSGRTKLFGQKERTNCRSGEKKAGSMTEKVYFR